MKKIAIIGNVGNDIRTAYSWFVKTVYDGFTKLGHDVQGINWKTNSLQNIEQFIFNGKFDIVFTHLTFHNHKPIDEVMKLFKRFRINGIFMIHTLSDARKKPRYNGDISEGFNMAFTSQLENLEKFKNAWKVPTFFWPYSSLTRDFISDPVEKYSFEHPIFTGTTIAHWDRRDFIKRLKNVMPILTIETKSEGDKRHVTPELSSSAKCILGLCTGYDIGGYIDVRPFQYLGCGAFMISRKFKWQEKILPDDIHILFHSYKDPMVVKDLWKEWKKKNTMPMRKKAFEFMQRYHSSKVRMENTLKVIEGKQDSVKALMEEL